LNNCAYGLVHDYYPREKMISIKMEDKITYFYFSKSQFKEFEKSMMYESVFVFFDYSTKTTKVLKNVTAYSITELHKISVATNRGPLIIYSMSNKKDLAVDQIIKIDYKMFVDFEFTMPSFNDRTPFTPEIFQIGAVISDPNEKIVNEYSTYIKTLKSPSERTLKFLKIFPEDLYDSLSALDFYNDLKKLITIYNPTIFVWGGNDIKTLMTFYKLHNFEPLKFNVIDLLKIIKNYYNLGTDIGLFKALKYFKGIDATQAHHALTDAAATKEVFDAFKKAIGTDFDLKEAMYNDAEKELHQEEKRDESDSLN